AFAKANSIPRKTFNNILAAKLCSSNAQICDQERKRQRLSPYENVDNALLSWIKYARSQNAPISWNVLKEKSLEFANELGESSFVASNGYSDLIQGITYPLKNCAEKLLILTVVP
ncbi:hypothetical protein AVEN_144841-1, partial [Araneus ventricosus]